MSIERAAAMAGQWWADRLQQGDPVQFAEEVRLRVDAKLREESVVHLVCDYDPWDILLDAVRAIGLECRGVLFSAKGILPMKHGLTVRADRLCPKEGYGHWTSDILGDDEPRPAQEEASL